MDADVGRVSEGRLRDSGKAPFDLAALGQSALAVARREMGRRHIRREMVGNAEIFGEPAWEMLLDLFIHGCEGKPVATSSLCIASGAPISTALRLLNRMCVKGIVARRRDTGDARRQLVELSPAVRCKLLAYFAAQSSIPSSDENGENAPRDAALYPADPISDVPFPKTH